MKDRDFETIVPESMMPHGPESSLSGCIEDWPDDDFSRWVVTHRGELKDLVCNSTLYEGSRFCMT